MLTASYTPQNISLKTKLLNRLRQIFQLPGLESMLTQLTINRRPIHFFSKLVPNHYQYAPGTIRKVSRGGIQYELDINNYVEHYLYFGFSERGQEKLFSLCQKHHTIIDIGTNIGSVLMRFALLAPEGRVIGFEPDEQNYAKCLQNLRMNHFDHVSVLKLGLGDEKITHRFRTINQTNRGMNRVVQNPGALLTTDKIIHVDRLDNVLDEIALERVDIIKIDVEGFELNVLKGAINSLKKYHPILFIELDDLNLQQQGQTAKELIGFLTVLGYSIQNADDDSLVDQKGSFENCHFDIICRRAKNIAQ